MTEKCMANCMASKITTREDTKLSLSIRKTILKPKKK